MEGWDSSCDRRIPDRRETISFPDTRYAHFDIVAPTPGWLSATLSASRRPGAQARLFVRCHTWQRHHGESRLAAHALRSHRDVGEQGNRDEGNGTTQGVIGFSPGVFSYAYRPCRRDLGWWRGLPTLRYLVLMTVTLRYLVLITGTFKVSRRGIPARTSRR